MDRLNAPTKMDKNYGRSFLLASYSYVSMRPMLYIPYMRPMKR